jgi:hypothetical protein
MVWSVEGFEGCGGDVCVCIYFIYFYLYLPSPTLTKKTTHKKTTQNPALRLVLAKHPELLDKSIEELERELDAKFDRTIR